MSKLGLVILMMLVAGRTNAQDYPAPTAEPLTYFVLIQADDRLPFYVRLDKQLYSSSPAGHLILSQLRDSGYTFAVGFPGQGFPEQRFLLNIREKDWAFQLSRRDNQWGLYDGQGRALATVADSTDATRRPLAGVKKDDAFSQLMSDIVQDTAVMYNTYAAVDSSSRNIVIDSSTRSTVIDSSARSTAPPIGDPAAPSSPTGVVKLSERRSTKSISLVFTDHPADKHTDTIDVVIPVDSSADSVHTVATHAAAKHPASTHRPGPSDTSRSARPHHLKPGDTVQSTAPPHVQPTGDTARTMANLRRTPSPDTPHSNTALIRTISDSPAKPSRRPPSLPFVNSDCHAFATDNDVDKLRIRMLAAIKEDDRIQIAYKVFKIKCFSTSQVRALSELFTSDAAKFNFLASAYPFVSDDRFPELVDLLTDPVYTGKFRTMTDHH